MGMIAVGVDLGATKIQSAVLLDGEVAGTSRTPTPLTGAARVVEAIVAGIAEALQGAHVAATDVAAIGIGAPGQIDVSAGTVAWSPNLPGFQGGEPVPLASLVSGPLGGLPVTLENDVTVALLGEHRRGAGVGFRDLLGVWVGTGVGGGLILDGELYRGRGGAGEIGHTVVEPGGNLCSCGRQGHLEAYAGRGCLEARARELHRKGRKTRLFAIMKKRGKTRLSSGVFLEALEKDDRLTRRLIDEAIWALGVALASTQNLLDVEAIVIGGGLGDRLGRPLIDRIAEEMQPQLFAPDRPPALLQTRFKDLSGAIGAAVLVGG